MVSTVIRLVNEGLFHSLVKVALYSKIDELKRNQILCLVIVSAKVLCNISYLTSLRSRKFTNNSGIS